MEAAGGSAMKVPSERVKTEAARLGFEPVGVSPVGRPPHFDAYERWLDQGFAGDMDYLERHRELKSDPRQLLPGAQSIVAVGLNYNQPRPQQPGGPKISKYALGRDYHKVLRGKLSRLASWVEKDHPGASCRACVDSAPILERDFAQLAGLGWFGKNTMLINSERGSWFFLGLLLTTVAFEFDAPAVGGCGTCHKCIDACPTGAIVHQEGRWQVDARKCISYLTIEHDGPIEPELEAKMGGWTVGCDVCQDVCPFNEPRASQPFRAAPTLEKDFHPRDWPSLERLAVLSDADWDAQTRGSATRRVSPQMMRRNASITLNSLRT